MKKNTAGLLKIISYATVVLLAAVLICQFVPYWSFEGQTVSIGDYIWFTEHHKDLTKHFQGMLGDKEFYAGNIAGYSIIIMATCGLGIFFGLKSAGKVKTMLFPAACGVAGLILHFSFPVFGIAGMGLILVILYALLVSAAVAAVVLSVKERIAAKE